MAKLLSRKTKAMRDGIQVSEAITGDDGRIFRHACAMDLEGIVSKRIGSRYVSGRTRAWLKTKNPNFVIWATTGHLKYTQYAPTNNNRTNNPMVTMSERLMRHLMLERR